MAAPGMPTAGQAGALANRLLYGSGVVNYALKDAAFGAFVLFYYKQVLGLSGTLTGLAIALSVLWDALSDPLVGAWSDRLRTRLGRRHPLMLASVVPMALSFIALFSPPGFAREGDITTFYWLLASVIALRTALTFFMVPYLALGAEISTDYHERTRLANARTNIGWFVGVLVPSSALVLVFGDSGAIDGRFLETNYEVYGLLSAAGVILFSVICLRGTWHFIPSLKKTVPATDNHMLRDVAATLSNFNFRQLVILETAIGGIGGILGALLMVTYTYFWELDTAQISLLFAGPPVLAVVTVLLFSPILNRTLEKQQILQFSCVLGAINLLWLTPLKLFDLLPASQAAGFTLLFINYAIFVTCTILRTVSCHSLLADTADEQELHNGRRQEGVMFAAAFFAAKFITGFGYLVAGPFLDLIGLQAGALPGQTPESVTWGLGLIMGPGLAVMMLLPVWMSFRLKLSRAGHEAVLKALADRA